MLVGNVKTVNFSARSATNDNVTIMSMTAYISPDKNVTFNQSIADTEIYQANKATADADYEEFKEEVLSVI